MAAANPKQSKKNKPNLSVVGSVRSSEDQARYQAEDDRWTKVEKLWRITRHELRQRVSDLRVELEAYREQLEAVPYDMPCNDAPYCLDRKTERKYHVELAESLNPVINRCLDMIDDYARQHGCHEFLDFQSKLFDLKSHSARTGFYIGMFASVIFSGAAPEVVDRYERGLTFAMSDKEIVQGQD